LEFELGELTSNNKELEFIVEQSFNERREKEDRAQYLEGEISRQRSFGDDQTDKLA